MKCCLCDKPDAVPHHVFPGANRKISERYHLKVPLCHYHHTGPGGFHRLKNDKTITGWKRKFCKMLGLDYYKTVMAVNLKHKREYLDDNYIWLSLKTWE